MKSKERKKKSWKEYTATVDDIMAFIAGDVAAAGEGGAGAGHVQGDRVGLRA